MKIVLTGGGTGGHVFPLVSVAQKLREKLGSGAELLYIGSGADLEERVMAEQEIPTKRVLSGKMRRYFSLKNFIDIFKIPIGFIQSLWILLWYMPDVIFSKGGYVAIPVVLAGWLYRIPILIHESDAKPGIANQILAKFSQRVAISYPSAEIYFLSRQTALTGNPIREEITSGDINAAREMFGLSDSKPTVLVLGGSQGAQTINIAVTSVLPQLLENCQVIHQTGERNYDDVVHRLAAEHGIKAGHEGYVPFGFLKMDQLKQAFAATDLAISRAGANTISEIAACGKPAILIPLDGAANDHQRMNAYELAKVGGAIVLEEGNLGAYALLEKINKILGDENLRKTMGEKIRAFYHPNAAEHIAQGIIELAG